MSAYDQLPRWLYELRVRGIDLDDSRLPDIYVAIMNDKRLLRSAFETFYHDMASLCDRFLLTPGTEIELGAGAGFFRCLRPGLVTSDVRKGPNIDVVLDAQDLALPDESARCIYAINVFHHLPNPDLFFEELCRVLRPGGGCILMEPHGGLWSTLMHRYLSDERFDTTVPGWTNSEMKGPLSESANQALAYIVFERDLEKFKAKYGDRIEIVHRKYCLNALRYMFSGGLNYRQVLPAACEPILKALEYIGRPLARLWTIQEVIVMRRR
jgi:SAM-dependent methyltransferase